MHRMKTRLRLARWMIVIVIAGLVLSGITAFPLLKELNFLSGLLAGPEGNFAPSAHEGFTHWILKVREGLENTYQEYPFIGYGTDWLAFGHLVIALFFIPPLIEPGRYIGNLYVGIWACVLVVPLAMIAGAVRGIPLYWRLIDCSFGALAIIPLLIAVHLVKED